MPSADKARSANGAQAAVPQAGNVFVGSDRIESFLGNARRTTEEHGLYDTLVVDCDCHHYEGNSYKDIAPYIDNPRVRDIFAKYAPWQIDHTMIPGSSGDRVVAGRVRREVGAQPADSDLEPVGWSVLESMAAMGIDYGVLFPTPMLVLGRNPEQSIEVEYARGYNRWLVREILPQSGSLITMPYLPIGDPEASLEFIEEFGDDPSVVGFMVTAVRYQSLHENQYMKVFASLEERGLPLAFHSGPNWGERSFETMNRFLSVHALGFPFNAMIHLTNLVINGIPERFPKLRIMFMECGVTWLPFIATRLDTEYLLRPSEAPLLKRLPSEYIADFYYTTQPIERCTQEHMEVVFKLINGENRLLYASDYPHQDFDLPTTIADLRYVSEEGRHKILGGNAAELFGLPDIKLQDRPEAEVFTRELAGAASAPAKG